MGIADNMVGHVLPSRAGYGNWTVLEKIDPDPASEGSSMSIGYRVANDDGNVAFMKASDIDTVSDGSDLLARLTALSSQQKFERKILEHCHGNNMDRVVTPIDVGDAHLPHNGSKEMIFWIIFEPAQSDARRQLSASLCFSFHWMVTALHNVATGLWQLHAAKVTHNDIRPSNVLCYSDLLQKLSDLGLAYSPDHNGLHYDDMCLGDPRLAAPELIYSGVSLPNNVETQFQFRKGTDLYLLGSLGYFFATGSMLTPETISHMAREHSPCCNGEGWHGTFEGVLPYYREGYSQALLGLKKALPTQASGELTILSQHYFNIISYLTEPDPTLRGHPVSRRGSYDPYSLERFLAMLDNIRLKSLS